MVKEDNGRGIADPVWLRPRGGIGRRAQGALSGCHEPVRLDEPEFFRAFAAYSQTLVPASVQSTVLPRIGSRENAVHVDVGGVAHEGSAVIDDDPFGVLRDHRVEILGQENIDRSRKLTR